MIFYFSGTGNSKHVAECLTDKNLVNIGEANKALEYEYEVGVNASVGVVCPVYYSGIPKPVLDFVDNMKLKGNVTYLYLVLTHGGGPGGAGSMLETRLIKKGYKLDACFDVEMPSNYMIYYDLKKDDVLKARIAKVPEQMESIIKSIDNKEHILPKWSKLDRVLTRSMKFLCEKDMPVKKFYADNECTGCGMCARNCPAGLIKMVDGKPQWTEDKCVRCMACLSCPHVQYGSGTKKRRRYSYNRYAGKQDMTND